MDIVTKSKSVVTELTYTCTVGKQNCYLICTTSSIIVRCQHSVIRQTNEDCAFLIVIVTSVYMLE